MEKMFKKGLRNFEISEANGPIIILGEHGFFEASHDMRFFSKNLKLFSKTFDIAKQVSNTS